jgi:hypothetical protein
MFANIVDVDLQIMVTRECTKNAHMKDIEDQINKCYFKQ